MVNDIVSDQTSGLIVVVAAGIEIALKGWKVTARDLNSNTVAGQELVARHEGSDVDPVDVVGLHQYRSVPAIAPPHALAAPTGPPGGDLKLHEPVGRPGLPHNAIAPSPYHR